MNPEAIGVVGATLCIPKVSKIMVKNNQFPSFTPFPVVAH